MLNGVVENGDEEGRVGRDDLSAPPNDETVEIVETRLALKEAVKELQDELRANLGCELRVCDKRGKLMRTWSGTVKPALRRLNSLVKAGSVLAAYGLGCSLLRPVSGAPMMPPPI